MSARRWIARLIRAPRTVLWMIIDRWIARPYLLWHGVQAGPGVKIVGLPRLRIVDGGTLILKTGVKLFSRPTSNPLQLYHPCSFSILKPGAVIEIGEGSALSGTAICAASRVTLGQRVMIGANCTISDTDFHPLSPEQRRIHPTDNAATHPVVIEDDVFVGTQTFILKGSMIRQGSVVGAGAVVAGDFPPRSVIAGNPAQVIKTLD